MGIGTRLKALMAEKNISQSELANKLDVTRMAVSNWVSGNREPDISTLQRITSILEISIANLIDDDPDIPTGWIRIPIIGTVPAGVPIESVEAIDGEIMIPAHKYNPEKHLAFRVFGDSMEPRYQHQDVVLVDKTATPSDKDVVIVRVNGYGEVTLKRFFRYGDMIVLRPDNPKYKDISFSIDKMQIGEQEPIHIIGKVVMLLADRSL